MPSRTGLSRYCNPSPFPVEYDSRPRRFAHGPAARHHASCQRRQPSRDRRPLDRRPKGPRRLLSRRRRTPRTAGADRSHQYHRRFPLLFAMPARPNEPNEPTARRRPGSCLQTGFRRPGPGSPNEPNERTCAGDGVRQTNPTSRWARFRKERALAETTKLSKSGAKRAESSSRAALHFPRMSLCQRTCHVREPSQRKLDARGIVAVVKRLSPTQLSANGLDTSERSIRVVSDTRRFSRFRLRCLRSVHVSLPTDSTSGSERRMWRYEDEKFSSSSAHQHYRERWREREIAAKISHFEVTWHR